MNSKLRIPLCWKGETVPGQEIIFHLAAFEHRHGSPHAPETDLTTNAGAVLELVEACRSVSASPRVVFASSANIYGVVDRLPVDETFRDDPRTLFGVHKLAAEGYLRLYAAEASARALSLRLTNLHGPSVDDALTRRPTLNRIVARGLTGAPLTVFSNKDRIRDFLFIDDAVAAFVAAAATPGIESGTYVIGTGTGVRLVDAVTTVADVVGRFLGVAPDVLEDPDMPISPTERRDFVADSRRFELATGWSARTPLAEGIARTVEALAGRQPA